MIVENIRIKPIEWTEEKPPGDGCTYNHVKGVTPLGEFLITWKGWKESPSYNIDNPINDIYLNPGVSLDDAKETAWAFYRLTVRGCIDYGVNPLLVGHPDHEKERHQYYYISHCCSAVDRNDDNCTCWRDEGTGPFKEDRHDNKDTKLPWRKVGGKS